MAMPASVRRKLKSRRVPPCPVCQEKAPSWQAFREHLWTHCRHKGSGVAGTFCPCCEVVFSTEKWWLVLFHLIDLHNLGLLETHVIHAATMKALLGDDSTKEKDYDVPF